MGHMLNILWSLISKQPLSGFEVMVSLTMVAAILGGAGAQTTVTPQGQP